MNSREFKDNVGVVLLVLATCACFFWPSGVTAPVPGGYFVWVGACAVLTAAYAWWRPASLELDLTNLSLITLVVWSAVSAAFSVDIYQSLVYLSNLAVGLCVYLIASQARDPAVRFRAIIGLGIGLMLFSFYGLSIISETGKLKGNFTNPDCFSVLPLGLYFVLIGAWQKESKERGIPVIGLAGWTAVVLGLTGCRSAAVGLVVGMVVFSFVQSRSDKRMASAGLVWIVPVVGLLFLLTVGQVTQAVGRWQKLVTEGEEGGIKPRLDVARYGPVAAMERPLFGSGPGTFHLVYQTYRPEIIATEDFMNVAHNDYIQIMVDTGVPGLVFFLVFSGSLCWKGFQAAKRGSPHAAGGLAGWIAISVYFVGNFALPVASDCAWMFAVAGLLNASCGRRNKGRGVPSRVVVSILGLTIGVFLLTFGVSTQAANRSLEASRKLSKDLEWNKAYEAVGPGLKSQPYNKNLYIQRAGLASRLGLFLGDQSWHDKALADLIEARRYSPLDVELIARLARANERAQHLAEAETLWRESLTRAPYNWIVRADLARNLVLQSRIPEALVELKPLKGRRHADEYGGLLAIMEIAKSGLGLQLLQELREEGEFEPEHLRRVIASAARAAHKADKPNVEAGFLKVLLELEPENRCARLSIAKLDPSYSEQERLKVFEELSMVEDPVGKDRECCKEAIKLWARAVIQGGLKTQPVILRIDDWLIDDPSALDLRVVAADLQIASGNLSEARTILREGLDADHDGFLHARLAQIFAAGGHHDIAVGYYKEALALNPKKVAWKKALERSLARRFE